jgi:hypothetical protein
MNFEFTEQETNDIQSCLVEVSKLPRLGINEMKYLIMLFEKFEFQKKEQNKPVGTGTFDITPKE